MEIVNMICLFLICAVFCGFIMGYVYRWHGVPFVGKWKTPFICMRGEISIGISTVSKIEELQQNSRLVLSRLDVNDVNAEFVADPFLFHGKEQWYMFMEVFNKSRNRGEIGLAISEDGLKWAYQSIVLREPFHLSYPYVFEHQKEIWMIPESASDNSVRLYRAIDFPETWKLEKKLLEGNPYTDPSIFQHKELWWMFVSCNMSRDLLLYFANDLMGPWERHPRSPIVYSQPQNARCAGRVVTINGKLIRFAQDCEQEYGKSVSAFCVECLDKKNYKETQLGTSPILFPSGQSWKSKNMHHIDLHLLSDGSYLASVDGGRERRSFGLKY